MSVPRSLLACLAIAAFCPASLPAQAGARWFHGGRILVGDEKGRTVESLLEQDGRVVALGSQAELAARAKQLGAESVDLRGAVAVPGLHDAHGHVEGLGAALEQVDLVGVASYDELVARVAAGARTLPKGEWVLGRGWDQNLWEGKAFPLHARLSAAVPDHPVLVQRVDGHAALANLAALKLAGLDGVLTGAADMPGGQILIDERGYATGVLVDAAVERVATLVPGPSPAVRERRILRAQDALLGHGLVCVHDMGIEPAQIAVYRDLDRRGLLELRVVGYLAGNGEIGAEARAAVAAGDKPDGRFVLRGMKLLADGALGSRGAALLEDYSDQHGHKGLLLLDERTLQQRLSTCVELGLQPAIHAIGDRANRLALDAIERIQLVQPRLRELRPRIEHAQIVAPKDWERFPALGVTPSMQPTHLTSDMAWAEERLGADRLRGAYAWRELAPDIANLAFGSDFPVESPDPVAGLYSARTRAVARSDKAFEPAGALSPAQALAAFTSGAARAAFDEKDRGRLLKGQWCDMTWLSVDPVACGDEELESARVLGVVVAGRVLRDARPAPRR